MGGASARDPFAGGDQAYLREVQYRDSTRLAARARLHVKYSTARVAWFPGVVTQIDWPAGARVLEVGCGAGWLWAEASAHLPGGLCLTLTDLSPGMVTEALGRVAGLGRHRRVEGRIADVQALPFAARSFDVVVANHMLYHVPDPHLGVSELARVVRRAARAASGRGLRSRATKAALPQRAPPSSAPRSGGLGIYVVSASRAGRCRRATRPSPTRRRAADPS